jgi:hypothetical protein
MSDAVQDVTLLKRRVLRCKSLVPPMMPAFCRAVNHLIESQYSRLLLVAIARTAWFLLRWLRPQNLRVEPTDNDRVFVLIPKDVVRNLVRAEFSKPCYKPVGALRLNQLSGLCIKDFFGLLGCAMVFRADGLRKSGPMLRSPKKASLCPLLCTIKARKTPVSARLVHSSSGSCLNAVSAALNALLRPFLLQESQLCLGSEDVSKALASTHTSRRSVFSKYDIKVFFLAGSHDFLSLRP